LSRAIAELPKVAIAAPMPLRALKSRVGTLDQRTARPPPKITNRFYLSVEWKALVAEIIAQRGRRCEECGRRNCRIFGDHIVELQDGGAPLDRANVRCLCGACHSLKSAAERAKRTAMSYNRD
ncbi:MAG: HNH endonuclease signature motif containing protein, partial [Pseudomonadota bacterium]